MSETTIGLLVLLTYTAVLCLVWLFCRGVGRANSRDDESMASGDSGWAPAHEDGVLGPRDMTRWPRRDWHPDSSR